MRRGRWFNAPVLIVAGVIMVPVVLMAPPRSAEAQELIPFTPSSSAGTLYIGRPTAAPDGEGLSIGIRITDTRAVGSAASMAGAVPVASDRTMVTGGAIVDVYPFSSGLRLSGGVRFGGSTGPAEPGAVTVRGETYPATLVTSPDGPELDGPTPYVGVGYGTTLFDGAVDLSIDAGALAAVPGGDGLSVNDRSGTVDPDIGDFLPMVGVSATYRF